jgi:RPA family protein
MEIRKKEIKEYENLLKAITEILSRHDPVGISFREIDNKYEPEAKTILRKLDRCYSVEDVAKMVHQDFKSWFSPEIAGEAENYQKIAEEIWILWSSNRVYKRLMR